MVLYNSELNNNGGFSLHPQPHSFVVYDKIDVTTLDSYKLKNISMIKIDVEGHEEEVLKGAVDTIKKNHPIIFVENLVDDFADCSLWRSRFKKRNGGTCRK